MVGVVTTRHLLTHCALIVREFGALCLFRCFWRMLTARHAVTFLECVAPNHCVVMRARRGPSLGWLVWIAVVGWLTAGCHNTAQGIKADTRHDLQKTQHAVQKVGDKIEDKK